MIAPIGSHGEPRRHPGSYVDPAGALFELNGEMLRGINLEFADFYGQLLRDSPVKEMVGRELVDTRIEPDGIPGYAITLRHRRIAPVSYCYEWPSGMLRDAALLTLDICLQLVEDGLVLQDGSPWNVVFDGTRPIFVDFTSIVREDRNLPWVAYAQFGQLFLYPLTLLSSGLPGRAVRSLVTDHVNGVTDDELVRLLPSGQWWRMPWLFSRVYLPRGLLAAMRKVGGERSLAKASAQLFPTKAARRSFFASLRRDVAGMPLRAETSHWAHYYSDMETFLAPQRLDRKQSTVARILCELRPRTVLDIGCNRGGFSILAAQSGAQVTAFDTDEASIAGLYRLAKERQLHILPLIMDVLNPSPAWGWRGIQFPSASSRFSSEMAMALALIHHLAITQRQTFDRIVPALADFAEKWLLTEFVPLDDPRSTELMVSHRRDMSWYTLEGFVQALRGVFSEVTPFPSDPNGRTILLCER
jgi:SAM-dependent methyltransferase